MQTPLLLELIHTEIPGAADQFAQDIFEGLSQQITEQLDERINDWLGDTLRGDGDVLDHPALPKVAKDIIQPAFSQQVNMALARRFEQAGQGWATILWQNMSENYTDRG